MYDIFQRRVILRGTVRTQTGLHIGTGRGTGMGGSDLPVIKDFNGRPFIPGSSFKGVLRSGIEAFLRSVPGTGGELACEVSGQSCVSNELKKKLMNNKDPDSELWVASCQVCRLFGSSWIASKVSVSDMSVADDFFRPEWIAVRDGVVIERETETASTAKGLKYDFEAVPAQTRFVFELLVENPEDYQLGLILLGLDFFNKGMSLLGGKTSRGLGRVEIAIDSVEEHTFDSIMKGMAPAPVQEVTTSSPSDVLPVNPEEFLLRFVVPGKTYDEHALVQALQQEGWTKDKVRGEGYANFRDLFQKMVKKGLLSFSDNRYSSVRPPEPDTPEVAGRDLPPDLQEKLITWRGALYDFLDKEIKGGSAVV